MALNDVAQPETVTVTDRAKALAAWPIKLVATVLDVPFRFIQRIFGIGAMPYFFILPNLAFFGLSGIAWVVPAMGVIWWMERPARKPDTG